MKIRLALMISGLVALTGCGAGKLVGGALAATGVVDERTGN